MIAEQNKLKRFSDAIILIYNKFLDQQVKSIYIMLGKYCGGNTTRTQQSSQNSQYSIDVC